MKYKNIRTEVDGKVFDSKREAARLDVRPSFTQNNKADRSTVNTPFSRYLGFRNSSGGNGPNLDDVCLNQFRECIRTPRHMAAQHSAIGCIAGIIARRAGIEMAWSNASFIVAPVANKARGWDCAVMKLIGKAVGICSLAINAKRSVTVLPNGPLPFPAVLRFLHIGPKTIHWRGVTVLEKTFSRTKFASLSTRIAAATI